MACDSFRACSQVAWRAGGQDVRLPLPARAPRSQAGVRCTLAAIAAKVTLTSALGDVTHQFTCERILPARCTDDPETHLHMTALLSSVPLWPLQEADVR